MNVQYWGKYFIPPKFTGAKKKKPCLNKFKARSQGTLSDVIVFLVSGYSVQGL